MSKRSRKASRRQQPKSFWERFRTPIVVGTAALGVLIVLFVIFSGPPAVAYSCESLLTPPAEQQDENGLGFPTPILGNAHVPVGVSIRYGFCPPTSGNHYSAENRGPIPARVYPPNQEQAPGGWVHNLEHGWVALLYRCPGGQLGSGDCASSDEFAQMQQWFDAQPSIAVCGKQSLVARFDQMETRFALVAWGRALLLNDLDMDKAVTFAEQWTDAPTAPEAERC